MDGTCGKSIPCLWPEQNTVLNACHMRLKVSMRSRESQKFKENSFSWPSVFCARATSALLPLHSPQAHSFEFGLTSLSMLSWVPYWMSALLGDALGCHLHSGLLIHVLNLRRSSLPARSATVWVSHSRGEVLGRFLSLSSEATFSPPSVWLLGLVFHRFQIQKVVEGGFMLNL